MNGNMIGVVRKSPKTRHCFRWIFIRKPEITLTEALVKKDMPGNTCERNTVVIDYILVLKHVFPQAFMEEGCNGSQESGRSASIFQLLNALGTNKHLTFAVQGQPHCKSFN